MRAIIDEIARRFYDRWSQQGKRQSKFSECAVGALREIDTAPLRDLKALVRWIYREGMQPQLAGEHNPGEPAVTIHRDLDMRIEVLFWTSTTLGRAAHDHKLAGAFLALAGDRLHNKYRWESVERIEDGIEVGDLTLSAELLREGEVHPIDLLTEFVHSEFLLQKPTVSLSVRSRHEVGRTSLYFTPGIRLERDEFTLGKQLTLLGVLKQLGRDEFPARVGELAGSNARSALHTLANWSDSEFPLETLIEVTPRLRARYGAFADCFEHAFYEQLRCAHLQQALIGLDDEAARFFIGLLWSDTDLASARALMSAAWGAQADAAARRAIDHIRRSNSKAFGTEWHPAMWFADDDQKVA